MKPVLWIVSPCYNSTDVLPDTVPRFLKKLGDLVACGSISEESRLLLLDDGSRDGTWDMILRFRSENARIAAVKLAHNSGEQNAYLAGLFVAADHADVIVSMDCDLQDDLEILDDMLRHYADGCDIVYGVRSDRSADTPLYRFLSGGFYKVMKLCKTELVEQNSQYRAMSKRAVKMLQEFGENEVFLPALVPLLGLKSAVVPYVRQERPAGDSGYSFGRLFRLAFSAIKSYSFAPVGIITALALLSAVITAVCFIVFAVVSLRSGEFDRFSLLMTSVWGIGTFLLASARLIAGYLCSVCRETKKRPRYQIDISLLD
ncbi:MAG: glycosyltransferase family 2 protein [Clostridia bacterium]|nr:glycosyltransferase family 2 protein [Clostridia bacterium]